MLPQHEAKSGRLAKHRFEIDIHGWLACKRKDCQSRDVGDDGADGEDKFPYSLHHLEVIDSWDLTRAAGNLW